MLEILRRALDTRSWTTLDQNTRTILALSVFATALFFGITLILLVSMY